MANALEQFKQLKPTHEMFDSCRNCGALQEGHENASKLFYEAVAAGSPYRYPLWLARALNSAIYEVKWDYESDRAIARIAVFYVKIAVFYNKFMLLCPIL